MAGARIEHPFDPPRDLERLAARGVSVLLVREDALERGLDPEQRLGSVEAISRAELPDLLERHASIRTW